MKNRLSIMLVAVAATGFAGTLVAQTDTAPAPSFDAATTDLKTRLDSTLAELDALRSRVAAETIPLSKALSELEAELVRVRAEYQETSRALDARALDLGSLRADVKARGDQASHLSNLLGEYARNFESRLHISEVRRFKKVLSDATAAVENPAASKSDVFLAQLKILDAATTRHLESLGGVRFEGTAVDENGVVKKGAFVLSGPAAVFRSEDGSLVGVVEQRLGSLEPTVAPFASPEDAAAAAALVEKGDGLLPFDPTQGDARKIETTKETLIEHAKKGGPVMYPIVGLAAAAFLVAFFKWISMMLVRTPSKRRLCALIEAVARKDREGAIVAAKAVEGPVGRMLSAGAEHLDRPTELIEEVMYEHVLATRLRLQKMLPFIAITSSSAPLLGLLGTVTGIMNTFSLMTVFGTGDVKTLSSGISEALITTEFGLYVAIPSLLLHAFLSRKAKRMTDEMEKAAVAFVNQAGKTPLYEAPAPIVAEGHGRAAPPSAAQVRDVLVDLLSPVVARGMGDDRSAVGAR
jgi:biopolymer transport protein ExbB